MTVEPLSGHLKEHGQPSENNSQRNLWTQPVKRVEIRSRTAECVSWAFQRCWIVHPANGEAGAATELGRNVL